MAALLQHNGGGGGGPLPYLPASGRERGFFEKCRKNERRVIGEKREKGMRDRFR